MGGKLGTHQLGQFKLGDSETEEAVAAVIVTGMFDLPTPAGRSDPGTPGASMYDSGTPGRVVV